MTTGVVVLKVNQDVHYIFDYWLLFTATYVGMVVCNLAFALWLLFVHFVSQ